MKIIIADDDGTVLEQHYLRGDDQESRVKLYQALDGMLGTLRWCQCDTCSTWVPEATLVQTQTLWLVCEKCVCSTA